MRKLLFFIALAGLFACNCENNSDPVLRHVVLFNWKDGTSQQKIEELSAHFASLPSRIDAIKDFEWGTDISVEGLTKDFTHCYIVTFASEKERDEYIPHPEHKAFGEALGPYLEDVLVVDFITQ